MATFYTFVKTFHEFFKTFFANCLQTPIFTFLFHGAFSGKYCKRTYVRVLAEIKFVYRGKVRYLKVRSTGEINCVTSKIVFFLWLFQSPSRYFSTNKYVNGFILSGKYRYFATGLKNEFLQGENTSNESENFLCLHRNENECSKLQTSLTKVST